MPVLRSVIESPVDVAERLAEMLGLAKAVVAGEDKGDSGWESKQPLPASSYPHPVPCRQELCDSQDSFEMCPLCLDCPFWLLSSACALAQV
ncbi:Anoctamin-7 [Plecturocebus cupreus]